MKENITLIILWVCILSNLWGIVMNWKLRKENKRSAKAFADMVKQHTKLVQEKPSGTKKAWKSFIESR